MDELTLEQLEEFRAALHALSHSLQADLETSAKASAPVELDQARVGRVSRIDAIQQQQMAAASREAQSHRVALVRQALNHLDEGTYGFCGKCEEPIGYGRLKARPEAAFCINCAGGPRKH